MGDTEDEWETRESGLASAEGPENGSEAESQNKFCFWNGDQYAGDFSVVKDKQKLMRHGKGIYKTADKQIYEGIWENDSLVKAKKLVFADSSEFTGTLNEMAIQGHGKYRFKENVEIEGEFVDNNFVGDIYLKDPNGNMWRGEVAADDAFVCFYPVHPFWLSLLNMPGKNGIYYDGDQEENGDTLDLF